MSDTESSTTAAAVDGAAVTEGVEQPHAAVSSNVANVMIAGQQTCAHCASCAQELTLMTAHNDALTRPMKLVESEALIFMALAHAREQDMFTASAKTEVANQVLQGDKASLVIRAQQAEADALHARSELTRLAENNICYEPWHKVLQDYLDQANCEIAELCTRETNLEEEIGSLQETLTGPKGRSVSLLGRKIEEGRRNSSGLHPSMASLIEEQGAADGEESTMTHLITGSELVIAGDIQRKVGNRRFTCLGNANEYHDQVQLSLTESDKEDNSEDADDTNKNGTSMDTSVPKMLKSAMIVNRDSDKLQELKIKNQDRMDISKFVTDVAKQLRSNKAEFLAVESLGGFAEYQEVSGAVSGVST